MTDFLTAAQIAALAGHPGVPLVQDTVTGVIYDKDGSAVYAKYRGAFASRPSSPADGYEAVFTDFSGENLFRYSVARGGWAPVGRVTIGQLQASAATGLATVTGVAAGSFSTTIALPIGLLLPGQRLTVSSNGQRTGATASGTFNIRVGATGTTADPSICGVSIAATTALWWNTNVTTAIINSTSMLSIAAVPLNGTGSTAVAGDKTINTASAMIVSTDISAANAADGFKLMTLAVYLEG